MSNKVFPKSYNTLFTDRQQMFNMPTDVDMDNRRELEYQSNLLCYETTCADTPSDCFLPLPPSSEPDTCSPEYGIIRSLHTLQERTNGDCTETVGKRNQYLILRRFLFASKWGQELLKRFDSIHI